MKRGIKRAVGLLTAVMIFSVTTLLSFAEEEYTVYLKPVVKEHTSENGQYKYVINSETGDAYFSTAFSEDITVLNIPKEIDGQKIVGAFESITSSESLIRINFSPQTKIISYGGLDFFTFSESELPICTINFCEGLKKLTPYAGHNRGLYSLHESACSVKLLVLPESLESIANYSILKNTADAIIIQGDVSIDAKAITVDDFEDYNNRTYNQAANKPCDIYFTGNADNISTFAFDYNMHIDLNEINMPTNYPCPNTVLYKKPGATGFDKFKTSEYQKQLVKEFDSWVDWKKWAKEDYKLPEGYTVKEYTDEWWKNITEIQSVTLSGKGVTEKADSKGLGTITNLGWSESNDPAQYLSHEYELSMKSGEKTTIASSFAPTDAYDDRVFFVSLDEDIADVDMDTGEITAKSKGCARIRAVAASGVYSDCYVSVDGGTYSEGSNEPTAIQADASAAATTAAADKTLGALAAFTSLSAPRRTAIISAAAVLLLAAVAVPVAIKKRRK